MEDKTIQRKPTHPTQADSAELARRLSGPHEWGYRDPVVGGFVADNTPFEAADVLSRQPVEADGWRALLQDIRACRKPAETIETVHGGAIDCGPSWSISGLTALLPRIDAFLSTTAQAGSEDARHD